MHDFKLAVVIPTYENPMTVRATVLGARRFVDDIIVIDDGSSAEGARACAALEVDGLAIVRRHEHNRGKGAAVKTGFACADALGFTHALQIDGDGQHDLDAIPRFLEAAQACPEALVLGTPVYDDTLHRGRYAARLVTRFWNYIEVLGPKIADSMCGFRVYPIRAAMASGTVGERMNFDIEIPVRMVWAGVPVTNLPVRVRYLTAEEGGVSHYQTLRDTARISWTHTKLVCEGLGLLCKWAFARVRRRRP